ncbi:MAG: phosphoglucomutase/phosphomannomutase family protein [Trueperaceae bacterium]|nr:phosphoglucomutase/phosphomannomutase family protein [Trueperaceae bacterium]
MERDQMGPGRLDELKFGTDGWREVIAERFTVANLGRAAQAYAEHLLAHGKGTVLVGYDTRFLGRRFANLVAEVLTGNGIEALVSADYVPTPALSHAVTRLGACGGVMVTASHNPAEYSGFKLKAAYGGSASDATYRDVAERAARIAPTDVRRSGVPGAFDAREGYFAALDRLVDMAAIARSGVRLVHDAMGGAGAGWLVGYFARHDLRGRIEEVRGRPDPTFYGVNPEPIAANLAATIAHMRAAAPGVAFAAATDGDADRIGVVLPGGEFFDSHQIFAVLLDALQRRGERGAVVKTFTVSRIVERLARERGLEVVETPVGFKHVADAMLTGGVLIGGEESGGIGVSAHLPERDGLANALLLLEAVAVTGVSPSERFAALEEEAGWRHAYDRLDLHLDGAEALARAAGSLDVPPSRLAGKRVTSVERLDGVKLNLADDAWVLVRASGTEPLLRVYCEAADAETVRAVLAAVTALVLG